MPLMPMVWQSPEQHSESIVQAAPEGRQYALPAKAVCEADNVRITGATYTAFFPTLPRKPRRVVSVFTPTRVAGACGWSRSGRRGWLFMIPPSVKSD
jgi:hypothetical protein